MGARVVAQALIQIQRDDGSGSGLVPPRACVMYCSECTSTRETVEMKMWNKIVIFVFFVQKVFTWLRKITVDRLMSHGLLCQSSWYFSGPWSCKDPCCLWRVWELSDSNKNILICVPKMNGGFTGLEQHEGEELMTEFSFLGEVSL